MKVEICKATDEDAEAVSCLIVAALRETNAKDYTQDIIDRVEKSFSPPAVLTLFKKRRVFVAAIGNKIVGTASLDGSTVRSVFVAPEMQGYGIGTHLMEELEESACAEGVTLLVVPSSVTAEAFYAKLGYKAVRDSYYEDEHTIIMERFITQTSE